MTLICHTLKSYSIEDFSQAQAGDLRIYTKSKSDKTLVERMRITPDGKIGIGTYSPKQELHIYRKHKENVDIRLQNEDGGAMDIWSGSKDFGLWSSDGNKELVFGVQNKRRLTIEVNGKTRIGEAYGQLQVGNIFSAHISGSSGGDALFGTNLFIGKRFTDATQKKTEYFYYTLGKHSEKYGYAAMRAHWGELSFYTKKVNTIAGGSVDLESSLKMKINENGLDVKGNIKVNAQTPIVFKKFTNNSIKGYNTRVLASIGISGNQLEIPHLGYFKGIYLGNYDPDSWICGVVGFNTGVSDYREEGKGILFQVMPVQYNVKVGNKVVPKWFVETTVNYHKVAPNWEIMVMLIRREIASI